MREPWLKLNDDPERWRVNKHSTHLLMTFGCKLLWPTVCKKARPNAPHRNWKENFFSKNSFHKHSERTYKMQHMGRVFCRFAMQDLFEHPGILSIFSTLLSCSTSFLFETKANRLIWLLLCWAGHASQLYTYSISISACEWRCGVQKM